MHPPSQIHRIVHLIPALAHLQFPLHDFPHPQWWRRAHALLASSRTVQNYTRSFVFTSCVQPHAEASGTSWCRCLACLQMLSCLVQSSLCMLKQHFRCGGMWSSVLVPCVKSWRLTSFTLELRQNEATPGMTTIVECSTPVPRDWNN